MKFLKKFKLILRSFDKRSMENWFDLNSDKRHRILLLLLKYIHHLWREITSIFYSTSEIFQNLASHIGRDQCFNHCSIRKMSVARFWIIMLHQFFQIRRDAPVTGKKSQELVSLPKTENMILVGVKICSYLN